MSQIFEGVAIAGALILYLAPAIQADAQRHPDAFAITLVNVLLGWTIVGWIAAFVSARPSVTEKRLPHFARRTQRSVARVTVQKLVSHVAHRAALQRRAAVGRV